MMRFALVLAAAPLLAAVDGVVMNGTTNLPQAGATVALYKLGQTGMEAAGQAKTDALGRFSIDQAVEGPHLIQSVYDGVVYNHMLPPGAPTNGVKLAVFSVLKKQPAEVKVSQHMVLFEPAEGQLTVNETYIFTNNGTTTWNDPKDGTLKFFLPPGAKGVVQVMATAPQGMPVRRAAEKSGRRDGEYKLDFAIKPGETRIDLTYLTPFAGGEYRGLILTNDEATRLVAPSGVTLKGEGLTALPPEPRTQANIYDFKGSEFRVSIEGTGSLRAAAGPAGGGEGEGEGGGQREAGGPAIEQIMPRIHANAYWIVGIALGILALGFIVLYRAGEASPAAPVREANERRRR